MLSIISDVAPLYATLFYNPKSSKSNESTSSFGLDCFAFKMTPIKSCRRFYKDQTSATPFIALISQILFSINSKIGKFKGPSALVLLLMLSFLFHPLLHSLWVSI